MIVVWEELSYGPCDGRCGCGLGFAEAEGPIRRPVLSCCVAVSVVTQKSSSLSPHILSHYQISSAPLGHHALA